MTMSIAQQIALNKKPFHFQPDLNQGMAITQQEENMYHLPDSAA